MVSVNDVLTQYLTMIDAERQIVSSARNNLNNFGVVATVFHGGTETLDQFLKWVDPNFEKLKKVAKTARQVGQPFVDFWDRSSVYSLTTLGLIVLSTTVSGVAVSKAYKAFVNKDKKKGVMWSAAALAFATLSVMAVRDFKAFDTRDLIEKCLSDNGLIPESCAANIVNTPIFDRMHSSYNFELAHFGRQALTAYNNNPSPARLDVLNVIRSEFESRYSNFREIYGRSYKPYECHGEGAKSEACNKLWIKMEQEFYSLHSWVAEARKLAQ